MIFLQFCPLIPFEQAVIVALNMSSRSYKGEITTPIKLLARYWYFRVNSLLSMTPLSSARCQK
jgi:hypothetical protein